jgi:F-box protein 3
LDVSELLPSTTWKQIYILEHEKWGKYGSCYTAIRRAWNQIEEFTKVHCPEIYASLNAGLSEEELERITKRHLEGCSKLKAMKCL